MSFTERLAARARGVSPRLNAALPHPFADRRGPDPVELIGAPVEPAFAAAVPSPEPAALERTERAPALARAVAWPSSITAPPVESVARTFHAPPSDDATASRAERAAVPRAPEARPPLQPARVPDFAPAAVPLREVHHHEHVVERTVQHHHHHHSAEPEPRARPTPAVRPVLRPERSPLLGPSLERPAPHASPAAQAAAPPPIHVHIGRIVVASEQPRQARARRERAPAAPPKTLAEHLADRRGRR